VQGEVQGEHDDGNDNQNNRIFIAKKKHDLKERSRCASEDSR
jgi:hypothetical protein